MVYRNAVHVIKSNEKNYPLYGNDVTPPPLPPPRDYEHGYTALMQACIEGDEIIVDVLVACVSYIL